MQQSTKLANSRRHTIKGRLYFLVMKKYLRLTLFCIAVASCALVLVYHHKYSDLNLILQMMNSFKQSSSDSLCTKKIQELSRTAKLDWNVLEMSLGTPIWTEIFRGIYTYSTTYLKDEVWVLSYVDSVVPSDIENMKCKLLYSNKTSNYVPIKVQLVKKHRTSLFVLISCKADDPDVPYGIWFQQHNISSATMLPITNRVDYLSMFTMCVEPLPVDFTDTFRVIEYLIYHHHIGVNHFIFYDQGMFPQIKRLLLEVAPKNHIFVTLLPWNVPSGSAFKHGDEFFVDCVLRTTNRNYSSFMIRGNINHFLVIKSARNLTMLMKDEKLISEPPRFYEEKFCLQYPDDIIAKSLNIPFVTLLKNRMLPNGNEAFPIIYNVAYLKEMINSLDFIAWLFKGFPQKSSILSNHLGILHSYENCNKSLEFLDKYGVQDKFMWKYKTLLFKSRILHLAKQLNLVTLN